MRNKRMTSLIQKRLSCLMVAFVLLGQLAFAQDTSFRRVQLANGISLDVPSHWTVLSQDTSKNIGAAGTSVLW